MRDATAARGTRPWLFTDLRHGTRLEPLIEFVARAALLDAVADVERLVLLGDMPRVKSWLIARVLSEFELSGALCFPVYPGAEGPVKGHPTAYPRELFGEVGPLVGDDTAMAAIRRHWSEAVKIPLDDASTQADIDTARDLELLRTPEQGRLL